MISYEPLRRIVADELFAPTGRPGGPPRIGAELELIPLGRGGGRPSPVFGPDEAATLPVLRDLARGSGWREELSGKGTPRLQLPDGSTVTYEPGGQIELSSAPEPSASLLVQRLRSTLAAMECAMSARGVQLIAAGIDPLNAIDATPLRFDVPRYRRMDDYFATIGPAGRRMMRQTASLQVCLDLGSGDIASRRWRVLNAAAPSFTALFANSRQYAGADSGHASHRAWTWRMLDPARTGLPWDDGADPAERYTDFALRAPAVLLGRIDGLYRPFAFWWQRGGADLSAWRTHLTTLFPEVRPRGYFEVRSIDALPGEWLAAPIVLLAGLAYDATALADADALLGAPSEALLARAATAGLAEPALASAAAALGAIALRGARALGEGYVSGADADTAEEYLTRWTGRSREAA